MDCVEAQGLISAGMDRESIPASSLAQAKEHCRTCPQCSAFVSTQLAARQAPLPKPPADLVERTMARVRVEAKSMAAERAAAAEAVVAEAESLDPATSLPTSDGRAGEIRVPSFINPTLAPKPKKERRLDRRWTSLGVAAAVIVALAGTAAVVSFGMRLISSSGSEADRGAYTFEREVASPAPQAAQSDGSQAQSARTPGPNAVTVRGMVYVRGESSDADTSTLSNTVTVSSSLGSGGSPSPRVAYRGKGNDTSIYIADDSGTLWAYAPVTREYLGDTYVLVSQELAHFGQWPTLPKGIDAPTDDEGGTTFSKRGTDSTGARVFAPSAPLTSYGSDVVIPGASSAPPMIALAPRTAGDVLAEDPNWTLWLQLP